MPNVSKYIPYVKVINLCFQDAIERRLHPEPSLDYVPE